MRHHRLAQLVAKAGAEDSLESLVALSHKTLLTLAASCGPIQRTPTPPPLNVNDPPELLVCDLSDTLTVDWQKKASEQTWGAAADLVKRLDTQSVSHTCLAGSARLIARAFLIQSLTHCFLVRVAVLRTGKIPSPEKAPTGHGEGTNAGAAVRVP